MKIFNIAVAVSLLAGFSVATTAFAMSDKASDTKKSDVSIEMTEEEKNSFVHYNINESGESYGTAMDSPDGRDPDLVAVLGDNGIVGYARSSDLDGEMPSSPEEAIMMQEEREKAGNPPRVINVYKTDGVTVIDTFTIGSSEPSENDPIDFNSIDYTEFYK